MAVRSKYINSYLPDNFPSRQFSFTVPKLQFLSFRSLDRRAFVFKPSTTSSLLFLLPSLHFSSIHLFPLSFSPPPTPVRFPSFPLLLPLLPSVLSSFSFVFFIFSFLFLSHLPLRHVLPYYPLLGPYYHAQLRARLYLSFTDPGGAAFVPALRFSLGSFAGLKET